MGMNCKKCGCYIGEYSGRGRPPLYCRGCAYTNNLQNMRDLVASKRAYFEELGTTNINSRMSRDKDGEPNFKKEVNIVRKELRKLRLKR